ncbi:iron uptake system component EfeO [Labedaea rhizosphaerae]|uniref:Iron uptake system component EfeO n=1 Tax=Labedaea rhizosphaerae TaxID=598644 RepID=A0A4R6SM71_LABRH|nr:iron uptake system component EfeO [Labedaea rhizosphaerae]
MTPSPARTAFAAAATFALTAALAACGNSDPSGSAGGSGAIAVDAKDSSCTVARTSADAGTLTFEVTNNGTRTTEFYLYGEGDRIMGEVENIGPGLKRTLRVEVPDAGKYTTACKPGMQGDGIRADFTVTGGAQRQASTDTKLAEATKSYKRYVDNQIVALISETQRFADAVKAGKVEDAKKLYPVTRTYYERIEPVAEKFGELDPKLDLREADLESGDKWTGYHRLEKDLWVTGLKPDSKAIADQLVTDVKDLQAKAASLEYTPLDLANGAKGLLDEVATGKITGEEDTFSHTDLWDFRANVDGSQAAIAALRPVITERNAALGTEIDTKFAAVDALLDKQQVGDGYKLYDKLSKDEVKEFATAVDALGEPISKVAEVVSAK